MSYMLNCPFKKTFLTLVALHIGDCKLLFFVCCCFGIRCNVKIAILIFLKWQVIENPLQLCYGPRTPVSRVKGFLNVCLSWVVCRCIHMILYCIVTRQHHTSSGPLRVQLNSASKRTQAVFVLDRPSVCSSSLARVYSGLEESHSTSLYPFAIFTTLAGNIPSSKSTGGINRKRGKNEC